MHYRISVLLNEIWGRYLRLWQASRLQAGPRAGMYGFAHPGEGPTHTLKYFLSRNKSLAGRQTDLLSQKNYPNTIDSNAKRVCS